MDKWISVEDRLPNKDGYLLFVLGSHLPFIGMYYQDEREIHTRDDECYIISEVSHWQPLPEPPNK